MATTRSTQTTSSFLELDGGSTALRRAYGGNIRGVVGSRKGKTIDPKTITELRYEPVNLVVGLTMDPALEMWVRDSIDKRVVPRSFSVVTTTQDFMVSSYLDFQDARITEVTLPTLDGASKDAGFLTIQASPSRISSRAGDQGKLKRPLDAKRKSWLCSNFRLRLGHLPCSRVSRIDSLTWRLAGTRGTVGTSASLEPPNLKVTFSAIDRKPWEEWFQDFCVNGRSSPDRELQGAIDLLSADLKQVLGTIDLSHVGIFALQPVEPGADDLSIQRLTAELYVERTALTLNTV